MAITSNDVANIKTIYNNPNATFSTSNQNQPDAKTSVAYPTTSTPAQTPYTAPQTGTGGTKVTTPVVTSQSAQDDYNQKFAAFQKLSSDLEARNLAKNQTKTEADAKAFETQTNNSKVNLEQQGLDIKKQEAETKAKALAMASNPDTSTPTPAPTTTPSTTQPTPVQNANTSIQNANTNLNDAQTAITAQKEQVFNDFQNKVSQITQGTFPLSSTEQALLNSVQMSLDRQKASVTGVLSMEAARGGQEYTPGQTAGMLANKVMDLDAAAAGTMASLRLGFQKQDYQMINDTYEKQTKFLDDKAAAIQKLHDTVVAQEKDLRDQAQKVQDNIDSITKDVAKNGATPEQIAKISASKNLNEAIANAGDMLQTATGTLGDYLQYKKDTLAKGLVPKDYTTFKNEQLYKEESIKASAKIAADDANTHTDKTQQKLEQQYRGVLAKEFSSRTGALGVENAKVNQANHLNSLIEQYYDPKTGDYNIPKSQYGELVLGLANLVSPSSVASDSLRAEINQRTAKGDINGAIAYVTGAPQNGSTQDIIKNFVDSIDRQAETALRNRETALQNMRDQAPTDLEPSRVGALNKSTEMVKYEGQARISKSKVDSYVKSNPTEAENISKLYKLPGWDDEKVAEYYNLK